MNINQFKLYRNSLNSWLSLKRISRKQFYWIFFLSVLSTIILAYQTLDYFRGMSCCGVSLPEIAKAFREYGVFLGLPISLYGIVQMFLTIILLTFISMTPFPKSSFPGRINYQSFVRGTCYLLLALMLISSILVMNLIYIEFIII